MYVLPLESQVHHEIAEFAPHIEVININPDKIGGLIGPGGKNIKKITGTTGATIDIEDDGRVMIGSEDRKVLEQVKAQVKELTDDIEVGKIYHAKVRKIMAFGAFCQIAPGKDGLCHVSELADHFVKDAESEVKVGDEFDVKVIGIDQAGRINLSRKQVQKESES